MGKSLFQDALPGLNTVRIALHASNQYYLKSVPVGPSLKPINTPRDCGGVHTLQGSEEQAPHSHSNMAAIFGCKSGFTN